MTGTESLIEAREVKATDGWTPLEFYAFIVRTLGLPARFHFNGSEWVGDGPFTKPVPQSILDLLAGNKGGPGGDPKAGPPLTPARDAA